MIDERSDSIGTAQGEGIEALTGIIPTLGELQPGAVITEEGLARIFKRCSTSVKRAVERGELPPPIRLFGAPTWTAGALLQHLEKRLEAAATEADQMQRKIRQLSP